MSRSHRPLVAIGIGNVLLGDDGVGVHIIGALRRMAVAEPGCLPPGTRLVDGGTLGRDLLGFLDGARGVVLVDAADRGRAPGTVALRRDVVTVEAPAAGGPAELLALAALLDIRPPVSLVEIEVEALAPAIGLSPEVEAAVPLAVELVRDELEALDRRTVPAGSAGARARRQPGLPAGVAA